MRINLNNHIRIVHMDEKDKYACQVNPVPKLGPVEFSTTSPGKKYRNPEIFPGKKNYIGLWKPPTFLRIPGFDCAVFNKRKCKLFLETRLA